MKKLRPFSSFFLFLMLFIFVYPATATNPLTSWDYRCCQGDFVKPNKVPFPCINTTLSVEWRHGYTRGFIFNNIQDETKYIVKNDNKYYGWCIDQNIEYDIGLPEYCVKLYSPAIINAKNHFGNSIEWDKVLYIINHRNGYDWRAVQEAIYHYVDGEVLDDRTSADDELIAAAEENGEGYVPPPGGKTILLADVRAIADGTVNKKCGSSQPYIIEIPVPELKCKGTKTIGYWKTHKDAWPVNSLTLGNETYSKKALMYILWKSTHGDASLILAKQLIAAKLNILSGADPDDISSVIDEADSILASYSGRLPYYVRTYTAQGSKMVQLAEKLDEYNNDNEGCEIEEQPKTCGCKTIYSMTIKYLGTTSATTVKAYDKKGNLVGEFPLNSDGTFNVDPVVKPEMTFVIGSYTQSIHTSCSQPIGPGMTFGKLLIVNWDAELKDCKDKDKDKVGCKKHHKHHGKYCKKKYDDDDDDDKGKYCKKKYYDDDDDDDDD